MGRAELTERLGAVFRSWVEDPGSDVVATELVDGRWAVRMAQQTRDFTTVWVEPGDRTVGFEAYVLPSPPKQLEEVYRLLLVRNHRPGGSISPSITVAGSTCGAGSSPGAPMRRFSSMSSPRSTSWWISRSVSWSG